MESSSSSTASNLRVLLEGKTGGWILNVAIVALVIAGLLLPPVSAQERIFEAGYTSIDRDEGGSVLESDGTQITVLPEGLEKDVKLRLDGVPRQNFLDGVAGADLKHAAEVLPSTLHIKSPVYEISVKGPMPTAVVLTVPIPNDAEPYEKLSLYSWNGEQWEFVPSQIILEDDLFEARLDYVPQTIAAFQSTPRPPQVSAVLPEYVSLPEWGDQSLSELNPLGYYLGANNDIEGSLPSMPDTGGEESFRVLPTLRNWTDDGVVRSDLVDNMLVVPEGREEHVQAIVDLVVGEMFAGIDLDYRGINPDLRAEFTDFVEKLADALHANGKRLTLHVEAPVQIAEDRWETGAYDWMALGRSVDAFKFPALQDPAAYAPGGAMQALLSWAVGEVERYKLQPVFTARSVENAGGVLLERTYRDALAELSKLALAEGKDPLTYGDQVTVNLETVGVELDETTGRYWFSYIDEPSGQERIVWLEDASSLSRKLALLGRYNIGGAAVCALWDDGNDPRMWDVVREYQASAQGAVSLVNSDFSVVWTVEDTAGGLYDEETTGLDQRQYTWVAPNKAGKYEIGASIVANGGQTVAGSMRVAVLIEEPTPTPTATPTPTPVPTETPTPTPTPTPEPTATPKPTAKPKPTSSTTTTTSNPPPNVNFGYGIQAHMVHNGQAGTVMAKTKDLGFSWVKQQVEWYAHEPVKGAYEWGPLDEIAGAANAAGVKILWSAVKAPDWARGGQDLSVEGPPNNPQDYADFAGALAKRYCNTSVKAIEVWNEQNLHYEWGNMTIDPAAYMALLKPAYTRIKQVCPSMIVVSGALTPTGAPAPVAMDDYAYLEGMYRNGLKNYSDAIGAHPSGFNVAPWVRGGQDACDFIRQQGSIFTGPCDTLHHSWSFYATLNGYYRIMQNYGDGNKKIWPTEFGWASGWTGTPGYEYADDNTLQEQAEWTVRSYQLMKQWGFVGVAFLWNLNFRVVNPTGEVAQWGIVWGDWSPTPAYNALKNMAK